MDDEIKDKNSIKSTADNGEVKISGSDGVIPAFDVKNPNLKRMSVERRKRRYTDWKKKYFTARGWNLIMLTAVFLMSLLVFSVLHGNHTLQQELSRVQKIK